MFGSFKNMFTGDAGEPKKPEPSLEGMLDVPQGVDPVYFSKILNFLGANNFDLSNASASLIRGLGTESMKTGEYVPFTETVVKQAQEVALDTDHPVHAQIREKEKNEQELRPSKREKIEEAYGQKFDPNQTHADLGGEETRLD